MSSHPSRVRGLKFCLGFLPMAGDASSHPSRVRGLKSVANGGTGKTDLGSHPSRVRGLKSVYPGLCYGWCIVAPFTGAWIEITPAWWDISYEQVAPFTGAWIEIGIRRSLAGTFPGSHPSRVRGLKLHELGR